VIALTISHYNGFFKLVEALLRIQSCFFSRSMKQRVLEGHAGPSPAGRPVVPGPPIWNRCQPIWNRCPSVAAYIQYCII